MRFAYQPSFLETTHHLSHAQTTKLLKAVEKFQHAVEHHQWPHGSGMTHLRNEYFEFRVDLQMRVIYRRTGDMIHYILYGNHHQVRHVLKTIS